MIANAKHIFRKPKRRGLKHRNITERPKFTLYRNLGACMQQYEDMQKRTIDLI